MDCKVQGYYQRPVQAAIEVVTRGLILRTYILALYSKSQDSPFCSCTQSKPTTAMDMLGKPAERPDDLTQEASLAQDIELCPYCASIIEV